MVRVLFPRCNEELELCKWVRGGLSAVNVVFFLWFRRLVAIVVTVIVFSITIFAN